MVLECDIQRKTHMHMSKHKQKRSFLVLPLRPTHVLHDDPDFLIMGIVKVTKIPTTLRAQCWRNNGAGQTQLNDIL